jgi:3-methyladenine DNA glycosylase/8-oxoguanine DNA glycosylase
MAVSSHAGAEESTPSKPDVPEGAALEHLRSDPNLAAVIAAADEADLFAWERARPWQTPFEALARAIAGQQISTYAAAAIYGRLVTLVGDPLTPAGVLARSEQELRAVGLSGRKVLYVRDLAERAIDGRLQLDRLDELSDDEVRAQLVAVAGIGHWSADMFLLFELRRQDVFPAGDLGLRKALQMLDRLDHSPTEKAAAARAERWSPYRSLATRYLFWWLHQERTPVG